MSGELQRQEAMAVRRHALGWLVFANTVGVLLSVLLLHPNLGALPGPFGYGRWMPLHLNGQLYGWCALPLAGVLLAAFRAQEAPGWGMLALRGWSLALGLGCLGWLTGTVSGKIFMDWHGWTRPLMPCAMFGLWLLLAHLEERRQGGAVFGRVLRLGLLAVLAVVPYAFYWAAGREVYPSVNPDSSGATGASLLASTLGILVVYGLVPVLLDLPVRAGSVLWRRLYWLLMPVCFAIWGSVGHGDESHHSSAQILSLGSLVLWLPLGLYYFRAYEWPAGAGRWLGAAFGWACVLFVSGWVEFLPGFLERSKFTHVMVAHAHLAMAGVVTSMNWALLLCLSGKAEPRGITFLIWQAACILHVSALMMVGVFELERPADLFFGAGPVQAMLALRLISGLVMLMISVAWLREAWKAGD